jgi:hypothetical protein
MGLVAGLLLGAACQGGLKMEDFFYRFTNLVPDLAGVDFFIDEGGVKGEQLISANMGYFSSSDFFRTGVDTQQSEDLIFFLAREAGTSNKIDAIVVQKRQDRDHHVFAIGLFNPGALQPPARLVSFEVARRTPSGSNVRLYIFHAFAREAGTQTPKIDFWDLARTNPIIENLDFGEQKVLNLPAGTYDFEVRIAGLRKGVLLTRNGVVLEAGKIYIGIIHGVENDPTHPLDFTLLEEPPRNN